MVVGEVDVSVAMPFFKYHSHLLALHVHSSTPSGLSILQFSYSGVFLAAITSMYDRFCLPPPPLPLAPPLSRLSFFLFPSFFCSYTSKRRLSRSRARKSDLLFLLIFAISFTPTRKDMSASAAPYLTWSSFSTSTAQLPLRMCSGLSSRLPVYFSHSLAKLNLSSPFFLLPLFSPSLVSSFSTSMFASARSKQEYMGDPIKALSLTASPFTPAPTFTMLLSAIKRVSPLRTSSFIPLLLHRVTTLSHTHI
mmetsp:Transcript_45820/g.118412  ORF Transcript_45820/g.118412 Transcript_45820/m.118412 type:complete len:250 (-) Transcript_45820:267-1016(-)